MKLILLLILLLYTNSQSQNLSSTLQGFCTFLYDIIGLVAFIMILLSSIVYSISNVLPADPRAKATVYAQNLFVGAILGIILLVLIPEILGAMIGGTFDASQCSFST